MRTIKVMADYHAHPLWIEDGPRSGNISPSEVGVSSVLAEALAAWAEDYTRTLNSTDPAMSGFHDKAQEEAFIEQGRLLAGRLAQELGPDTVVKFYHSGQLGIVDCIVR